MKKKQLKADIGLLCGTMQNQSGGRDVHAQYNFASWILKMLSKWGNFTWDMDEYLNLYITKGTAPIYPCVVAHLDTVHPHVDNYIITHVGNFIVGIDGNTGQQVGTGCDDRVGIAIALQMFQEHDNIKLFFAVDEEVGGIGSGNCNIKWFEDCAFLIQPDRNFYDKKDYINHTNGIDVTTKEFDEEILPYLNKHGYIPEDGTFTDIGILLERGAGCCAFNLSCYLHAHTDGEVCFIPLYEDALNLVNDVIVNMSYKRWEIKVVKQKYNTAWLDKYNLPFKNVIPPMPNNSAFEYVFDEEVYENEVDAEVDVCALYCEGKFLECDIDNTTFCSKCKKTLGQDYLMKTLVC